MKILVGPRARIDAETGGPFMVFVLSFYPNDKMVTGIGGEHLLFKDAWQQAKRIEEASGGAIVAEVEPEEMKFPCSGCGECIDYSDIWWYSDDTETKHHFKWNQELRKQEVCGPVTNYREP